MIIRLLLIASLGLLALAPPSGRPPVLPLERYEPKLYDLTFEVLISTTLSRVNQGVRGTFNLKDAPIVMPVIYQGTYSLVQPDSVSGRVLTDRGQVIPVAERIDDGQPFYAHNLVMTVPQYRGSTLRWRIQYRAQAWSSRIDEAAASKIPWPREWPDEVKDGLQPQMYIQSDHEVFKNAINDLGGVDKLHTVTPWVAAKHIVQYCLSKIQVSGNGLSRRDYGLLQGLDMHGAANTATLGRGSPHDLVSVCVALLRAAGIPARPVIGVYEDKRNRETFTTWAEFYLPNCGWVPFDPNVMQGKGVRSMAIDRSWPEFGTMKELNERIPLAYHYHPPVGVEVPGVPAVWGWDPRPGAVPGYEQSVTMDMVSRGKGVEDPR